MIQAEVASAVADAHRREWAYVLAATVRVTRDFDIAEDCAQEAFAAALSTWPSKGVPNNPGAWLTTTAKRRALDVLRHDTVIRKSLSLLVDGEVSPPADAILDTMVEIPDDRLRLIFTCCHPALSPDAQVALTLKLVCGLATSDIAKAFLVSEPTMAARITRAKKKITGARIRYAVPDITDIDARLDAVLTVVHLLFTIGHSAPAGADLMQRGLVERSIDLA